MEMEFSINCETKTARHMMIFFNHNEPQTKEFADSPLGYVTDYEGVGIFLFRHLSSETKWYVMTVQNTGVSNMFKADTKIETAITHDNTCTIMVEREQRLGIRV